MVHCIITNGFLRISPAAICMLNIIVAWVANGRLTAYWEYDLSSWDQAAGYIIVSEAGGKYTDLDNQPYSLRTRKMIATNGKVHQEIIETLNDAGVI